MVAAQEKQARISAKCNFYSIYSDTYYSKQIEESYPKCVAFTAFLVPYVHYSNAFRGSRVRFFARVEKVNSSIFFSSFGHFLSRSFLSMRKSNGVPSLLKVLKIIASKHASQNDFRLPRQERAPKMPRRGSLASVRSSAMRDCGDRRFPVPVSPRNIFCFVGFVFFCF